MLKVDITLLYQFIPFLIAYFFLSKFLFRPSLEYLKNREALIDGKRKEAEMLLEEIKELRVKYQNAIDEANREAKILKDKIHQEGLMKQAEIISKAKEEAQKIIEEIRSEIVSHAGEIREELLKKIPELTELVVKKLLPG